LKKLLTILILLIGLNFTSTAQFKSATSADPSTKLIKFYPNPATTVVTFELQRGYDKGYSFQISSFIGKKIYEQKRFGQRITINLNEFYRGFYFYNLFDKNGKMIESGKFQVVK
jgi:Secretion system C-terminal sorting domain